MNTTMDMNHTEAWKAVTEFSKTVLSLSATLLAVIASYLVLQGATITLWTVIAPALLTLAIVLSLYGFGHAIKALKTGTSQAFALVGCNLGAVALLLSILSLPFTLRTEPQSIDSILATIESSTQSFPVRLSAGNCKAISKQNDSYLLTYVAAGATVQVEYSITKNEIVSIK